MTRPQFSPSALCPSIFSIVLGTGGVSLCLDLLGMRGLALALLALNALFLLGGWLATACRAAFGFRELLADLTDLIRGPSFFFVPLATSIFGLQAAVLMESERLVAPLFVFSLVLWILLSCVFVVGAAVRATKAPFVDAISPTWFLPGAALIGTMGLGTHLARIASAFILAGLYGGLLIGFFLNAVVMVALLYRWLFFPLRPEPLFANHWINMGGFAIVVVAGLKFAALHARSNPLGTAAWIEMPIRPCIIFSWLLATWWLPILCAIGIWRHAVKRVSLRYEAPNWALVFSPSVYALATAGLVSEYQFHALLWVPPLFVVFATLTWVLLMIGFLRSLTRA